MKTLSAPTATRWIEKLIRIEAAFRVVIAHRPDIDCATALESRYARIEAETIRQELMALAVGDVGVEVKELTPAL